MTSTYPSVVATLTNPNPTDRLNAPSHSGIETAQNTEIVQIETVMGTSSSALGTIIGDLRNPSSPGGGHIQTANKGGTGQTAYIKGDVLVASSSSVLAKLSSSGNPDGYALVIDSTQAAGVKWGVPNSKPTVRIFSVTGTTSSVFTWVKPSVLSYIRYRVQGPGGGGASVAGNSKFASGGAAGGYAEGVLSASVLGLTEEVRIGGGGRISSTISAVTSFGLSNANASILGNPGEQGAQNSNTQTGGTALGGNINIQGQGSSGAGTVGAIGIGGDGGSSPLGEGGKGGISTTGGGAGPTGYGSGGPGAATDSAGNPAGSTAGQPGIVIIEEY